MNNELPMSNPAPEGNKESSPSDSIIEMSKTHASGLTNGEVLQLRMLADALRLYNETGMHLTNPIHINRCFEHWMKRIGQPSTRMTWRTKEKLVHKHFGPLLAK